MRSVSVLCPDGTRRLRMLLQPPAQQDHHLRVGLQELSGNQRHQVRRGPQTVLPGHARQTHRGEGEQYQRESVNQLI